MLNESKQTNTTATKKKQKILRPCKFRDSVIIKHQREQCIRNKKNIFS